MNYGYGVNYMETMRKTCKHLEHTVSLNSDSKQGIIQYGHPQYSQISYLLSPTNTLPHNFLKEFHVADVQELHTTS
jgi:hypothetical protein